MNSENVGTAPCYNDVLVRRDQGRNRTLTYLLGYVYVNSYRHRRTRSAAPVVRHEGTTSEQKTGWKFEGQANPIELASLLTTT